MHHMFVKLQADTHKLLSCLSGESVCSSASVAVLENSPKCFSALFILKAGVLKRILTRPTWPHTLSLSLTLSSLIL